LLRNAYKLAPNSVLEDESGEPLLKGYHVWGLRNEMLLDGSRLGLSWGRSCMSLCLFWYDIVCTLGSQLISCPSVGTC
jgi:hypothetical protein